MVDFKRKSGSGIERRRKIVKIGFSNIKQNYRNDRSHLSLPTNDNLIKYLLYNNNINIALLK